MEFASPRWAAHDDTNSVSREPRVPCATYAVSAQYAAYANRKGVYARKLATNEHYKRLFRYEDDRPWFQPVLAFSTLQGKLLAIATGVQILVFDVDTRKVKHALKGNGRIITSLAWAESKPGILATGAVDGSICAWSLKHPARPLYHVRAFHGACNHVAFHPKDHELLAGCHRNCISVWALPSTKPFLVTKSKDSEYKALRWFATSPLRVLGISSLGSVSIYDVHQALKDFRKAPPRAMNDSDEEDTMFGKLEDIGYMPASDFQIGMKVSQAMLVGRNGLLVLPRDGHILFFIAFFAEKDEHTELWRLRLDATIDCFSLRVREKTVHIVACMGQETQSYEVPGTVLDGMGWDFSASTNTQYLSKISLEREEQVVQQMRPELSIYQRLGQSPSPRTASIHGSGGQRVFEPKKRDISPSARKAETGLPATIPTSITSSLELPTMNGDEDEHDSPMPFLSPSIPARRASTVPLDESLRLPPRASFDSITSTAGHDSDSDDETFAEHLQGSGSYLPGGVNVPLPRTCGARFGASGQLLTFFLTRAKPASVNGDAEFALGTRERQDSEVTRLFPSFGNLTNMSRASAIVSESEGDASPEKGTHFGPRYSMPASSLDNNLLWSTRVSPVKAAKMEPVGQQKVAIAVHEVQILQHAQRLAYDYRLLPEKNESVAEMCLENAHSADGVSREESAETWRLLALLVEQRSCDRSELVLQAQDSEPPSVNQRPMLSRNLSLASSYAERALERDIISLSWTGHPLGRSWAIEQILDWAERQADVQLLACVASLLIRASEGIRAEAARHRTLLTADMNSLAEASHISPSSKTPPSISLLRTGTDLTDASLLDESPVKPYSSRASSRDPSLPSTPYIDSSGSTPPLALPPLARHNTRLSASGSASPETSRGSFSAAAKYYAQTISDKLAGYSTSPPTRRLGGSPGNELSTSLPTATGSWSKSVSFATATASDTLQDSQRSLSLAQEDDNYDSDRTIDDMSLPRTPNPNPGVVIRELNGQSFYDDQSAAFHDSSFLPEHLVSRCSVWRDTYAEQLRSWDLVIEAAELENIADLAGVRPSSMKQQQSNKVVPHLDPQCRGATCCICYCSIKAAKQLCPACLHTTHPRCLDEFVARLDEDDSGFTCPTGCGCECTAAGQQMYELDEEPVVKQSEGPIAEITTLQGHFAKKRSLTDPRLLRERLEGNSW